MTNAAFQRFVEATDYVTLASAASSTSLAKRSSSMATNVDTFDRALKLKYGKVN